jgi:hypothetical protein
MQKIFALVFITIVIASCNSGIDSKNDAPVTDYSISDTTKLVPPAVNTAVATDTAVKTNTAKAETVVSPVNPSTNPQVVLNNSTAKTAKGMNPAHGLPNHRCDIPVGAPLSTPAGKQPAVQQPVVQQQPVQTVTSQPQPVVTQSPVVTAPGMNPPHGQPGHDCSIEVGKPLKKAQ